MSHGSGGGSNVGSNLRVVVRCVHGGSGALGGRLAQVEGRVQVIHVLVLPGTFQQPVGLDAEALAFVAALPCRC